MRNGDNLYGIIWLLSISYFGLIILPYLVFGFSYVPWIISIPDLIDLAIYPVVICLLLITLFRKISGSMSDKILYSFITLLALHLLGHGFHWAANAIHETIKHSGIYDSETLSYAYFLDEIVSHKIMYYPLYLILMLLLIEDFTHGRENLDRNYLILSIPNGFLFGFSAIISAIEGQSAIEALLMATSAILIIYILSIKEKIQVRNYPYIAFMLISSITMLIIGITYWFLFGGFIEPSQLFK